MNCIKESEQTDLKQKILSTAGELFFLHGYSGTTFQKIADILGITKGSITYHFKNKFMLMEHFIDNFFQQIRDFIDSFPEEYQNTYWRYCVMYIYAYRRIMSTPGNIELFYHKDQQHLWQIHKVGVVSHIYEDIERDFHKSYDMGDLEMKVYIDMGMRSKFFSLFQENPGFLSLDQYCYYHIYLIGLLCRLDEITIQENIKNAFDFANGHELVIDSIFE